MEQRKLGDILSVSALGLGCMGMSEFYGATDEAQSMDTLAAALDAGINFFDTADIYGPGHNEELLGRFAKGRRERLVIATKFGIVRKPGEYSRSIDNSPAYVRAACEASLKRLNLETIDLYYCHRRNPETPIEEMVGAMADLVKAGKVRALGLSEVSVETLERACKVHPIAAVQSEYSLWSREPEQGMLDACARLGSTFVAYSPLGRAFLTGKVQSGQLEENDFRRANPRFAKEAEQHNARLVASLAGFAQARKLTAGQVALAWLLNKHKHVVPIPGTKRRAYLEENARAARVELSAPELAQLDELFSPGAVAGGRYTVEGMKGIEA
jgi:aryl-alcohol dehydrogenase-like predicted oxidoreductase